MVKLSKHIFIVITLLLLSITALKSQDIESLEDKIKSLQNDIKLAERLLKETSKNKEVTLNQVNLLKTQISQRENLIKTYQKQVNLLNNKINNNKTELSRLKKNLKAYREEYSGLILLSYKNRNNLNNLLFIISAEDFNQAIKRWRYVQEFRNLIQQKINDIDSTEIKVNMQLVQDEQDKKSKEQLLAKEKKEQEELLEDKKKLDYQISLLKKKEKKIQKEIKDKETESKKLKKQIEEIIEEELKKAKEREDIAKSKNRSSEDIQLSNDFTENKSKLPWPVNQGIISSRYGLNQHPTQSKVKINNNGIDITTIADSKALAVFEGEVSMIVNSGNNKAVLIRHGHYFTLYSNLDVVYVKRGDKIKTMQEIGHIHTSTTDNKTILHFELWEDKKTVDPAKWLRP